MERDATYDQIHAEAMRMWREREDRFPPFTRRLKPDDLDYQSGAWGLVFAEAMKHLRSAPSPLASRAGEDLT